MGLVMAGEQSDARQRLARKFFDGHLFVGDLLWEKVADLLAENERLREMVNSKTIHEIPVEHVQQLNEAKRQRDALAAALRVFQWADSGKCPVCDNTKEEGHYKGVCPVGEALATLSAGEQP